jgi:hypothetical protein
LPCTFAFADQGTAFVEALAQRQTSFGALSIDFKDEMPFSSKNLKRLMHLETLTKLKLCPMNEESVFLPFSARAKALHSTMYSRNIVPQLIDYVHILPRDLCLKIHLYYQSWDQFLIFFFNRLTELRHFERLSLSIAFRPQKLDHDRLVFVVEALMNMIYANQKLKYLSLGGFPLVKGLCLQQVCKALEDHRGIRTLAIQHQPKSGFKKNAEFFSWVEQLLSSNRKIEVVDEAGKRFSDGPRANALKSETGWTCRKRLCQTDIRSFLRVTKRPRTGTQA